jgi:hypothetical protein
MRGTGGMTMADAWEEVNGENLVWVPGHYERKD